MSTTTLEVVELTVDEPEIICDSKDCSATAIYIVRLFCSCIRLSCRPCWQELVFHIATYPGSELECVTCGAWVETWHVNDFVNSINKL